MRLIYPAAPALSSFRFHRMRLILDDSDHLPVSRGPRCPPPKKPTAAPLPPGLPIISALPFIRPTWPMAGPTRSEEHTSELQSLMRSSYAVFCLTNRTHHRERITNIVRA